LASASPRRKELLESAALVVEVRAPYADESWPGGSLLAGVKEIARRKMAAVGSFAGVGIAADTVVVLGKNLLGKPADRQDAARMLRALSGREHKVVTGFCVRRGRTERLGAATTRVTFRRLSQQEIARYVATDEPLDKAGAYAIQGLAGAFVDRVVGSYTNIIGLPLAEVLRAMEAVS